jgi:hypothetical protein
LNDSLERLLKEAKAFAWKQTALAPEKRQHPTYMPYANPENWTKGELVELIYQGSPDADTLSLGLFRELIYRHGGRKLVREGQAPSSAPPEILACKCRREVVSGTYWLEPRPETPEAKPWPEQEVLELRHRLISLIEEWEGAEDE